MPTSKPHGGTSRARLVVADEHAFARAGLRAMLAGELDLAIVGEATSSQEVIDLCQSVEPDLVLLDLRLPGDALHAIAAIGQVSPRTRVLVYVIQAEPEHLQQAQHAGAAGYLLKEASHDELVTAIRRVLQGEVLF
jgi:DNA-binding NarL/FixJ family response regulator